MGKAWWNPRVMLMNWCTAFFAICDVRVGCCSNLDLWLPTADSTNKKAITHQEFSMIMGCNCIYSNDWMTIFKVMSLPWDKAWCSKMIEWECNLWASDNNSILHPMSYCLGLNKNLFIDWLTLQIMIHSLEGISTDYSYASLKLFLRILHRISFSMFLQIFHENKHQHSGLNLNQALV